MRTWQAIGTLAAIALLTGCATTRGPLSASGRPIPPAALVAAETLADERQVPAPVRPYFVAMHAEGRENQTLHALRGGLVALRLGEFALAAELLDVAARDVESLQEGAAQARRAQSKFVREQEKWFKGETYERSALYVYRGLLYLREHDFGNAAACFKRAQLHDITGEDAPGFAGDWYSAELLLALASYRQGVPEDAARALERTKSFTVKPGEVTPPQPGDNLLVFVETGVAPVKYRAGQYGEQLRFREMPTPIRTVELWEAGQRRAAGPAAESLFAQATTRGTRQVDFILAGKAQFKQGTEAGALALGMGAVIASQHRGREANIATGVLAGLAVISAIASSATTPEADIRAWENLPNALYVLTASVPPGEREWEVRGLDARGGVVQSVKLKLPIETGSPLRVLFVKL